MRNSEHVRNLRVYPKDAGSDILIWGVDVAIPHKAPDGTTKFLHFSGKGEAFGFEETLKAVREYVEGL